MCTNKNAFAALLWLLVAVVTYSGFSAPASADTARPGLTTTNPTDLAKVAKNETFIACSELIEACFAKSEPERSDCFYSSGHANACANSELGRLSLKRWSMSTGQPAGEEAPLGLLGPKLVDKSCVENFDGQWSSALVSKDFSVADLNKFNERLDACIQKTEVDLTRP